MASATNRGRPAAFLRDPAAIRAALGTAMGSSAAVDIAAAFVGRDWADVLGTFSGKIRLVCWLTSANTNPYAVEQMLARGAEVRHLDSMHAKVYLCIGRSPVAIVGSANLSGPALASDNAAGQCEAAALLRSDVDVVEARAWFRELWSRARPVTAQALRRAKEAWEAAHRSTGGRRSAKRQHAQTSLVEQTSLLPAGWRPSRRLRRLAVAARKLSPEAELRDETRFLSRLEKRPVSRAQLLETIERLSRWTGHIGAYYPALRQREARIARAFHVLFDRSRPVAERLCELAPRGRWKLRGIGLPAWTILLSWRYPREYPPFDRRTKRFLQDFGLDGQIRKTLSATQYGDWVALAQELSARLGLPSAGHVDRLVWAHTRNLQL